MKRKCIEFNNKKFYLSPENGYYEAKINTNNTRNTLRLHREVWEFYNGKIPENYHIHHIDGNKLNNSIENLELLSPIEHAKKHSECTAQLWQRENMKIASQKGREKCKIWHASDEGKKWHSEHQKETVKKLIIKKICPDCGAEFTTWNNSREQKICKKCRDKYLKRELRRIKKVKECDFKPIDTIELYN